MQYKKKKWKILEVQYYKKYSFRSVREFYKQFTIIFKNIITKYANTVLQ